MTVRRRPLVWSIYLGLFLSAAGLGLADSEEVSFKISSGYVAGNERVMFNNLTVRRARVILSGDETKTTVDVLCREFVAQTQVENDARGNELVFFKTERHDPRADIRGYVMVSRDRVDNATMVRQIKETCRSQEGEDALVMRVRALMALARDKEALDVAESTSADVKARLTQYIQPAPLGVQTARQNLQKYASTPAVVASTHLTMGEYTEAVRAQGEDIRQNERTIQRPDTATRDAYLLLMGSYKERAVMSSAAGNRIGSQRDFETALDLCRKQDCEAVWERDIYISRAISSFLLGDLSSAANDCSVVPQFGGWPGHASSGGKTPRPGPNNAEDVCAYVLSSASTQPQPNAVPSGGTTVVPGSTALVGPTVRDEIEKIRSGRYAPMPPAQRSPSGGSVASGRTTMTVKNSTSYELSVFFDGPVSQKLTLVPGASQDVDLAAGTFHVAGRVAAASVLPFYGEEAYAGSARYSMTFYIAP